MKLLKERYEVTELIEGEHQSTLWRGKDRISNKEVVIKEQAYSGLGYSIEREILQRINHEHLPLLLDVILESDKEYIVLLGIQGRNLDQILEEGEIEEEDIVHMLWQLCEVVGYLHQSRFGIVHRDITPRNIILNERGHLTLIDFGASTCEDLLEYEDKVQGTVGYSAPEAILYSETSGRQSDLYGIGAILWACIQKNPDIYSMELILIAKKAKAIHPKDRYGSIEILKRDVELLF